MSGEVKQFEDFSLDRGAHVLRRGGQVVHLQRLPLELLFLLVERRGHLVTRQEILDRVWGKGVFVDVDNAINTAIRKIRRALDDDSEAPRFVVTVPAMGYRFIAALHETKPETSNARSAVRSGQSALVGRERELARLRGGLAETVSGHGSLFLISGAPGVGKTRLSSEMARLADEFAMTVLIGHCAEQDEAVPYLPFVEVLESCLDRATGPERLRAMLEEQGPELSRILPMLRRLIPDLAPPLVLPPEQARRHLFNSICDFIGRLAREKPILLIVEDLHWADAATLSLLIHLADRLADLPAALIATYRDADADIGPALAKTLENLIRSGNATRVTLKGLGLQQVGQMLKGLSNKEPPPGVVNEIYAETNGNPFFVEELVRHLREEDQLFDEAGEFRSALNIAEFEVPQSIRLVVGRRLTRIGEPSQKMLASAAVIGRSFTFEILEASTQSGLLLESIEEAEKAGLISSDAESPGARFEFSHEIIRQTVLNGLSVPRRKRLHLDVAGAIERIYGDRLEDHSAELAHHFSAADDAPKAVRYLFRCGQQAAQRYAHLEAKAFFIRSLELLQKSPDDEHRVREELKIQKELVQTWWILRGESAPETRSGMERMLELSERLGASHELFVALNSMMSTYLDRDAPKARQFAERELAVAQQLGDPTMIAFAHAAAMGHVLVHQGEFVDARTHLEKGLAMLGDPGPGQEVMSWQSWARSPGLSLLAWDLWFLGYPDQALQYLARALAASEGESHPFWRSSGWFYALRVYVCLRHPGTLEVAIPFAAYSKQQRISDLAGLAPLFVLWSEAERGQAVEAVSKINLAKSETYHGEPVVSWISLMMAEMCAKAGNMDLGLTMVARGLGFSEKFGFFSHKAELHRLHGELLLMQDRANLAEAERCYRTALDVARKQNAKSWELRATTSLAQVLDKQSRRDEARAMLADIYGWFTEGFDTRDLIEAKALLDQLNG